jgi:glyoxylase-like metal-dependent hydrolase (beta-lactamase superfamily II)
MNNSVSFKFGDYQCIALRDTFDNLDLITMYPDIKPADLTQLYRKHNMKPVDKFEITCLVIKTGKHNVLIDTGWGEVSMPNSGMLIKNMAEAHISPAEIDIIVHSHCHPDHIGGNTDSKGKNNFPNAKHFISQDEFNFWNSNPSLESAGDKKQDILKYLQKNVFAIIDHFEVKPDKTEFIPGFSFIKAPGHTPGHSICSVSSGTQKMYCLGDVFHSPVGILNPTWRMEIDNSIEQAIDTRLRTLEMVASSRAIAFGYHLPFPGIGQILKENGGYLFKPMQL